MKESEDSDKGESFIRSDTDDDSSVVDTSGNSEVSSFGNEGSVEGKGFIVDDVALERKVLFEGGTAGLERAVDCCPRERWAGAMEEKMVGG